MSRWLVLSRALVLAGSALAVTLPGVARAQSQPVAAAPVVRTVPLPVTPPPEFQAAIDAGTRTTTGRPGPRYWQNWTDYQIRVRVIPETKRVEGSATIRFQNRSPGPTRGVVLDLLQNFHAPGVPRLEAVEVTGGMQISRLRANGVNVPESATATPRYQVTGTKMVVVLAQPLAPQGTLELEIDWSFTIPAQGISGRMGHNGENLIFLAYFYPQMSVLDDVVGWHTDPFLGTAEFYAGFGSYRVTVEAPSGWVVNGTGELTNADQVLSAPVLARLRAAEQSDTVVHVLRAGDVANATRSAPAGEMLSWSFEADSVRDVAYSLTRQSLWDATRTPVGDRDGDGRTDYVRADALYRAAARRWVNVARYAQHAVRFLSEHTGYIYPWSHMTAVEGAGIIGGGMEYPMMTLIGDYTAAGDSALYDVTVHEIAHMWVPMIVSTDERRYSWLDEGTTTFNENQGRRDFFPGSSAGESDVVNYLNTARAGAEGEMMRRSDYHYPGPAFVTASYYKPAVVLDALHAVLGEETFNRAYREFFDRWAFKHAYPWDLWNTFEDVAGRDLDWFWRSWYYETWTLDQAVESVTPAAGGTRIMIADRGNVPMPVRLTVRLANGSESRQEIPVESWLAGERSATVTVPGEVTRVEIDAERRFPDIDRENNVWTR